VHAVLLGFVTMMIYGVAYHVIPRFSGHPLHGRRAAGWHWGASNLGLALMVLGFVLRAAGARVGVPMLAAGGALSAAGAYTFAYLLWRTIDGPARRAVVARGAARAARLPLAPGAER
jgi:cbb3-type cytochrome oxidase subunit 1